MFSLDPMDEFGEPTWRLRERMKTVSVALVLCLNIGTDPPDVVKVRLLPTRLGRRDSAALRPPPTDLGPNLAIEPDIPANAPTHAHTPAHTHAHARILHPKSPQHQTTPCARKECWINPFSQSRNKSLEAIGNALQQQYNNLQNRAVYRQLLDPTVDELRKLTQSLRRRARSDRLLFHYNGA